jgi:acetylglutamate kinase
MPRIVVKLGGSALTNSSMRRELVSQVAQVSRSGVELIVVHGGGAQIASMLGRLQIQSKFHDGLRITDQETRDIAQMVLAGKVGKDLVADLAREGIASASIAGGDGLSFLAERMTAEDGTDLGYVGRIIEGRPDLIDAILRAGVVPLVACIALGASDREYYNINGDQMAAAVAAFCKADQLIFVTDVGAVRDAAGSDIRSLDADSMKELLATGVASGGMRPKLRACLEATESGVARISIIGGAVENSFLRAITGEGVGTVIERSRNTALSTQ